jgi:hypothetical protein
MFCFAEGEYGQDDIGIGVPRAIGKMSRRNLILN